MPTQQAFAAEPEFSSFVADDPDDLDTILSNGDTLTITFSEATNATNNGAMSQTELTANFTDTNIGGDAAVDWGTTFSGVWNADSTVLTVTLTDVTGATLTLGTSEIEGRSSTNISSSAEGTNAQLLDATSVPATLSGDFGLFVAAVTGNPGGGACNGDCIPPTLGVDRNGDRVVENGFTYNGKPIDVERYFTPYPLITVQVGVPNKAVFKIYEGGEPGDVRHFELAFGLANGARIDTANAAIIWDKTFGGMETVTLIDPENVLENVSVKTSSGSCTTKSTQELCLIVTVDHTFRAPLDFNMVGSIVWDENRNGWQNYYNEGIAVEGESLNPPKQYEGIHKGHLITITETGKNKALDENGNTWTFDGTWIKDFINKGKIDDPISSQGYDRNHVRFSTYKQGQELIADSLFEKYYKTSFSQEPAFSEIDDIKFYEFPDRIDKKFDPVLQAKMHGEDIRAQKYLEEMFAKIYPHLVSAEYPN